MPVDDMYRTFNMGIGMVLVVPSESVEKVCQLLVAAGESGGRVIGEIVEGDQQVVYD